MSELSEEEFRRLLQDKGLNLEGKAFAAALKGARHLRAEAARLSAYLAQQAEKTS